MTPMDVLIVVERFFLYWLAYSFAGWVWETGLSVVLRKRFEDRGMLNGPICPIYGFGGLLVVVLLHDVNKSAVAVPVQRRARMHAGICVELGDRETVPHAFLGLFRQAVQHQRARVS